MKFHKLCFSFTLWCAMCVDAPPCVTLWHLVGYFGIPECPLRPTWCQIWYFWHQRHNIMMSAWPRNGCNWLALRSHNIRQQRIAFICVWWFVCDINVTFLSCWSIKLWFIIVIRACVSNGLNIVLKEVFGDYNNDKGSHHSWKKRFFVKSFR